ncbi:MAG: outer membrane beta-barrel protein, partial [Candidatus Aminicenantes bacterium]|nr:outer membrane beta-barrel protein [Candidatus Aminicenantes bacterium]
RYGEHPDYKFFNILFPLSGELNAERHGEWRLVMSVANHVPDGVTIRLSAAVAAMGGTVMKAGFNKLSNQTGEPITVTATLTRDGTPLTGVSVTAECSIPVESVANILHDSKFAYSKIAPAATARSGSGEPVDNDSLIAGRIAMIEKQKGAALVGRISSRLTLFDDGQHGDGAAGDGVYANVYTNTRIPGNYDFRFLARNIATEGGNTTTREWTESFYNQVNTDVGSTRVRIAILDLTGDGTRFGVQFVPRDRFGNYLGPGYPVTIEAFTANPGTLTVRDLKDNLDGTYSTEFFVSRENLAHGPRIKVLIDGKEFAQKPMPTHYQAVASLHGGISIPISALANTFDLGFCGMLDFGYNISPVFSVVGLLDYCQLPSQTTGVDPYRLFDVSVDAKYKLRNIQQNLSAYFMGGAGFYFQDFTSLNAGFNAGAGLEYGINQWLSLDFGGRCHYMPARQEVLVQAMAGLVWRFQIMY